MVSFLLNSLRFFLWPKIWSILKNVHLRVCIMPLLGKGFTKYLLDMIVL